MNLAVSMFVAAVAVGILSSVLSAYAATATDEVRGRVADRLAARFAIAAWALAVPLIVRVYAYAIGAPCYAP